MVLNYIEVFYFHIFQLTFFMSDFNEIAFFRWQLSYETVVEWLKANIFKKKHENDHLFIRKMNLNL